MRRQVPPWGEEEAEGVTLVTGASPEVTLEERLRGDQQARISARAAPEGEVLVDVTEPPRRRGRVPAHNLVSTPPPEELGEDDEEARSDTGEVDEG